MTNNHPHNRLRHHVTGAIERGEAEAITEQTETRDSLVVAYIGDGYLYGASGAPNAHTRQYWAGVLQGETEWELVELRSVPADIAANLEAQGTIEQFYSDGYEAARAAAPFIGMTLAQYHV